MTVGEIWSLADQFGFGEDKRDFLKKVLETLVILDINHESILDAYVEVDRACRKAKGGAKILSKNDLWIAATTKAAGAVLVTTDKDFLCLHPEPCPVHYIDPILPKKNSSQARQSELKLLVPSLREIEESGANESVVKTPSTEPRA